MRFSPSADMTLSLDRRQQLGDTSLLPPDAYFSFFLTQMAQIYNECEIKKKMSDHEQQLNRFLINRVDEKSCGPEDFGGQLKIQAKSFDFFFLFEEWPYILLSFWILNSDPAGNGCRWRCVIPHTVDKRLLAS
ncbi:hypothetical protein F2P81_003990 [Scophthalmus maximus]|uniref:Uncharacterized protein n=1 Tax=Scophthalmus maximus TaxID=52904 RepID=A0A6A4TS11_SCOMX|nr:hypothetical protein F2P81_003990 [Scophthalmus maximus]